MDRLSTRLQDAGFEMSLSLKAKWQTRPDALKLCRDYGREIARQWAPRAVATEHGEYGG